MLEPEIAALRDILLRGINCTNSESQATKWAREIIERLDEAGYFVVTEDEIDGG